MTGWTIRFVATAVVVVVLATPASANAPAGRYTLTAATVYDTKTKLTWQRMPAPTQYLWADAKSYCGSAAVSTALGGTGWRLPTIKELLTIVDFSQPTGAHIDLNAFPGTPPLAQYWSLTPYPLPPGASSGTYIWTVVIAHGGVFNVDISSNSPLGDVRCVR